MNQILILINGMPGTGKSTLAEKISKDLGIPFISKDQLKEFLADKFDVKTREQSRSLGATVLDMLYVLIDGHTKAGNSIIVESPLFQNYAKPHIQKIVDNNNVVLIEIYCRTEQSVRRDRIRMRAEGGDRHQAHILAETPIAENMPEPTEYQPLDIANLISVDTTFFDDNEYDKLLENIRNVMREVS